MPESTRVCPVCEESFTPQKSTIKFCSDKCRATDRLERNKLRRRSGPERSLICPICDTEFTTVKPNQRFCKFECAVVGNRAETKAKRQAARVKTGKCLDPGCGRTFEPVGRQRYCSTSCTQRMGSRRRLGIANPALVRNCWWCDAEFMSVDGRQLYCSEDCKHFVKSLWNVGKYGITRDDYRDAWYRQGGVCVVCKQPERTARNHLLSIDHDHETGRFRGLLCSHCNRAIGLLQDDPKIIAAAADYLLQGVI